MIECLVLAPLAGLAAAAAVAVTGRSGQQDDLTRCLANLRAIGQASLTYAAEDASEFYIPVPALEALPNGPGAIEWGGKAGMGEQASTGQVHTSIWGTGAWRGPAHRPLNRFLYRAPFVDWNPVNGTPRPGAGYVNYIADTQVDVDVYRCPVDTGYAGGGFMYTGAREPDFNERPFAQGGMTAYDHYGNSYVANTFFSEQSGQPRRSLSAYFRGLSSVPAPAHTIAYQEVPSQFAWMWGDWSHPSCAWVLRLAYLVGGSRTISGWHGTNFGFNVAFADGHASMTLMQGCLRPAPHLGSTNYPSGVCGPTIPDHECLRCVIIRGPGWQLDTLPAPPTDLPWTSD